MQMLRWRTRATVTALTLTMAIATAMVAAAAEPDNRAAVEAAVRQVEASPKNDVGAALIARSRAALDRAAKLRARGDEAHARLAIALAKTWADAARGAIGAVEVEERAQAARRAATDRGVLAERERALLEEGIAQSGRLRAQLESVEREANEQPARTSTAANAAADGGTPRPKGPTPSPPLSPPRDGGAP